MKDGLDKADKVAWIQQLLIKCPLKVPLDNCPAADLRKLPIAERLNFANEMSEKQLDLIILCHKDCLASRAGNGKPEIAGEFFESSTKSAKKYTKLEELSQDWPEAVSEIVKYIDASEASPSIYGWHFDEGRVAPYIDGTTLITIHKAYDPETKNIEYLTLETEVTEYKTVSVKTLDKGAVEKAAPGNILYSKKTDKKPTEIVNSITSEDSKFQYSIKTNDDLKCLLVTARGVASGEDFINIAKALISHPSFKSGISVFHDYSVVNVEEMSSPEVRNISNFVTANKHQFDNGKWAIEFNTELGFGLARMFQAFTENNVKLQIKIFKKHQDAWNWLKNTENQVFQ